MEEKFREQYRLLRRAASSFDEGNFFEAQNLAVRVRVLVDDPPPSSKSRSRSLLRQLGLKDSLLFEDSRLSHVNGIPHGGMGWSKGTITFGSLTCLQIGGPGGPRLAASGPWQDNDERRHAPKPFRSWANDPVLERTTGPFVARMTIVRWLANQDGGAHVDEEVDVEYDAALRDGMGVLTPTSEGDSPIPGFVTGTMRQIAAEVQVTLERQCAALLSSR